MKTIRQALRSALRCGAIGGLAVFAVTSHAQETQSRQIALDIEPQSMSDALNDWAQQTGLQLIFPDADITNRLAAPSVRGTYTAQAALNQLLAGTQLTYEFVNDRTVSIRERHPDAPMLAKPMGREQREPYVRLVDRRFGEEMSDGTVIRRVAATQQDESLEAEQLSASEKRRNVEFLAEVVVTGSHIHGVENSTAPITVLDKAYIDSTGLGTTTGLIESLPQNFALASPAGVVTPGVTGPRTQGSSINLRGLGEGTTLVLLNGRRMALGYVGSSADIAALPLSAVERVEVLTDGASAVYGSDAVGGVVNFILRSDFDGAETRVRTGWSDGGVNEYRFGQVLGNAWDSGNALVSVEYYKRDLLPASERDFVPEASDIGSLFPKDRNYSAMLSGRQNVTNALSIFADGLYMSRDSYHEGGRVTFDENYTVENPQTSATVGLDWRVGQNWQIEASGSYARNELDYSSSSSLDIAAGRGAGLTDNLFEIQTATVKIDGSVFMLPGGSVRVAAGVDWRSESLDYSAQFENGTIHQEGHFDQIIRSVFGEMHLPIVGARNSLSGIKRLELSLAGRFDDYSSFGSSVDPRYGLMWEPLGGLRIRGSYGSSYVAPKLSSYSLSATGALALTSSDPESPTGRSRQLRMIGNDVGNFSAQESKSASFGVEFVPDFIPGLQVGLNYYEIDYRNRIASPPSASVILGNPSSFGSLFIRNPSIAEVNEHIAIGQRGQVGFVAYNPDFTEDTNFDPSTVSVIVDARIRNLSVVKTSGLDVSIQYGFKTAGSDIRLGMTGTYISELVQKTTSTSTSFDTVDTIYNPPSWRARGFVSWERQGWAANLFVNHTNSYTDNRTTTPVPISSYTVMDARLAYDFNEHIKDGLLSGVTASVSVQNLSDRDPPHTAIVDLTRDMGFDPTNANPMGRLVAIEFVKAW